MNYQGCCKHKEVPQCNCIWQSFGLTCQKCAQMGGSSTSSGAREDRIYGLISFTWLGLTDFTWLGLPEFYDQNILIGVLISYWAHCSTWRGNAPHKKPNVILSFVSRKPKLMKSYLIRVSKCILKQKCNLESRSLTSIMRCLHCDEAVFDCQKISANRLIVCQELQLWSKRFLSDCPQLRI